MEPQIRVKDKESRWTTYTIGEISTSSKGNGYSKGDLTNKGIPIILYGRMYTKYSPAIDEIDTFVNPKDGSVYSVGGEIIIPGSGETAEDIAIASHVVKPGVILGGDLNILKFNLQNYDPTFLALAISYGKTHQELSRYAQGKTVVHLRNSDIAKGHLTCPSLDEQKAIVEYFNSLDKVIQSTLKKIESLKQIKAASLQAMFPQEGETTPKVRFKGFDGEWEKKNFDEVFCVINDNNSNIDSKNYKKQGKFPIIDQGSNLIAGYTDENNPLTPTKGGYVIFGDHTREFKFYDKPFYTGADGTRVLGSFFEDVPRFLFYFCCTLNIPNTGYNRHFKYLKESKILIPSKAEQKQIANYFRNLDTQISLQTQRLEKLKQIKAACLDQMFV